MIFLAELAFKSDRLLDALILFLDPDITAPNSSETVKQPEKLSRGAAPVRQKKTIQ